MSFPCHSFSLHSSRPRVTYNHAHLSFFLVYFSLETFSLTLGLLPPFSIYVHLTFALFLTLSDMLLSLISLIPLLLTLLLTTHLSRLCEQYTLRFFHLSYPRIAPANHAHVVGGSTAFLLRDSAVIIKSPPCPTFKTFELSSVTLKLLHSKLN